MKSGRKALGVLGAAAALVLIALVVLPVLFRGPIERAVKAAVNRGVAADVDWRTARLSFLRNFPNATLRLSDLAVTGAGPFAGDTLAALRGLRVVLDLRSVLGSVLRDGRIVVRAVELDQPVLHLRVLDDGTVNWQVTRTAPEPAEGAAPASPDVALRSLVVRGGRVYLDNRATDLFIALDGLDLDLSGDFARDRFVMRSRTHADEVTVRFAGVPWLSRTTLAVTADIDADMAEGRFVFRDNEVRLNELALGFAGSVARAGDDLDLDITFDAPRAGFRDVLSLIPAVYASSFAAIEATGEVAVGGRIHGRYGAAAFPAFAMHARVDDGMFRYPDLPLPARDIFLDVAIDNPGGDADSTVVDVRRLQLAVGGEPITGSLVLRTPVSDPDIDFRLNGRLDLADAQRTFRLDDVEELAGVVTADVAVRTRLSHLDEEQYDRVTASGTASLRNMVMRGAELPHPVSVDELTLRFTPRWVEVPAFHGTIGASDIQLTGRLDNLIGFALRDDVLRGSATLTSRSFDLDEWRSDDSELTIVPVPGGIDFTLDATVTRLLFDGLEMANARGRLHIADRRATLDDFRLETLGGSIALGGWYETVVPTRPTFDMALVIDSVDIPAAFTQLETVRRFAPVAQYSTGSFSADLRLNGALGTDMMPLFEGLNGRGSLLTSAVAIRDFPALDRLADALRFEALRDPALAAIRSTVAIRDGRLHVNPFDVPLGESRLHVAGSNGIDQSLDYTLTLAVPRSLLGAEADRVVASLITRAGRTGLELRPTDTIELAVRVGGTVRDPSVNTSFGGVATSVRTQLEAAAGAAVDRRVGEVAERADSAREEARRRAAEEADRVVAEAEQRAEAMREEARTRAEAAKAEGHRQADALLDRASSPVARAAARPAADRLRREADERAEQIIREADRRADELVEEARRRADAIRAGAG